MISYFIEYIASNILRGLNRRKVAKLARTEIFYQKSICICYKFVISSSKRIFRYRNQWFGSFPFETGSGSKFGSDLMLENINFSLSIILAVVLYSIWSISTWFGSGSLICIIKTDPDPGPPLKGLFTNFS